MGHKECLVLGAVGITEGFFSLSLRITRGHKRAEISAFVSMSSGKLFMSIRPR